MGFEIWRHITSGARYLVVYRNKHVLVAAGPLSANDDPHQVLATHSNQHHNPTALLDMRQAPHRYAREYATDARGRVIPVVDPADSN